MEDTAFYVYGFIQMAIGIIIGGCMHVQANCTSPLKSQLL